MVHCSIFTLTYHESLLDAKVIMDDFGQGGQAVGGAGGITGNARTNTVITTLAHVCLRGLQLAMYVT